MSKNAKNADHAPKPSPNTASPARNFTLTTGQRVAAIAAHMPAYARRRRMGEDIQDQMVTRLERVRDAAAKKHPFDPGAVVAAVHAAASGPRMQWELARLNDLVDRHNRYYPWEKNLPIDIVTHEYMDRGEPWRPSPHVEMRQILERVLP